MVTYSEDADLDKMIQDLKSMFDTVEPSKQEETTTKIPMTNHFQPPIKSGWKVSGLFSMTATDPRHPKGHMGVDMRAAGGTPIYPLAPGIVTAVTTDSLGGNVVYMDHANGIKTYYAHCGTISVHKGEKVGYDTQIATVGNTGNAKDTWPHLHFQVWSNGQIQNPNKFFTVPPYTNPTKDEKMWQSEDAKKEAMSFNLQRHVASKKTAFTNQVNDLLKIASQYYNFLLK